MTPGPEYFKAGPVEVPKKVLVYLDVLRESGVTNMYGAAPYLTEMFGYDKRTARELLMVWMSTFEARHNAGEVK